MSPGTAHRIFGGLVSLFIVQPMFGQDLATRLATPELRDSAVEGLPTSGDKELVAHLLSLSETPPPRLNPIYLDIGLAEAFGKLRATEGIPFLIRNITLDVSGLSQTNTWMKSDAVVEGRLPAMVALIAIGRDASKALIARWGQFRPDEQIAALYVISRVADPAASDFLTSLHPTDAREARYVQEGLKAIQGHN